MQGQSGTELERPSREGREPPGRESERGIVPFEPADNITGGEGRPRS